ncbi:MAG: GNAT family N-acetyltransferase [Pseudomonadota bacterium]
MNPLPHEAAPAGKGAEIAAGIRGAIPELATERLILRAPEITDFPVHLDIVSGPRGAGIGGPFTRDAAWADFVQLSATWLWRGHGAWSVVDRGTGAVLGFVLIGFEPGDQEPELGFMFTETGEGRGYAAEAARAAMGYARDTLGFTHLVSYVLPGNVRSEALIARLGGTRDGHLETALSPDNFAHVFRYELKGSPQ